MTIVGLIVWILCAYLCYVLASKSKHNAILALILGLIFGVLALVVYLVLYLIKK